MKDNRTCRAAWRASFRVGEKFYIAFSGSDDYSRIIAMQNGRLAIWATRGLNKGARK